MILVLKITFVLDDFASISRDSLELSRSRLSNVGESIFLPTRDSILNEEKNLIFVCHARIYIFRIVL